MVRQARILPARNFGIGVVLQAWHLLELMAWHGSSRQARRRKDGFGPVQMAGVDV